MRRNSLQYLIIRAITIIIATDLGPTPIRVAVQCRVAVEGGVRLWRLRGHLQRQGYRGAGVLGLASSQFTTAVHATPRGMEATTTRYLARPPHRLKAILTITSNTPGA